MATVLVLDDEPINLDVISAMLARRGHEVLPASTGEMALGICGEHPGDIDLIVADVMLRGLTAAETARQIAPLRPDIPVLFVSGASPEQVRGILSEAGVDAFRSRFLQKPFTVDQLDAEVERLLRPVTSPPLRSNGNIAPAGIGLNETKHTQAQGR